MRKVAYEGVIKNFVDQYDGANYKIWNETAGMMKTVRKHIRDHYLSEQMYTCAYCRIEKKEKHGLVWDVEHVLPKSKHPKFLFEPENLAISCKECNGPKDANDILVNWKKEGFPSESKYYRLVHPHFDVYSENFEITEVNGRRKYRVLNGEKAKYTYFVCNLIRFDYEYAEWDSFDDAIVDEVSKFLDRCPRDAMPSEVKRMLSHLTFVQQKDY